VGRRKRERMKNNEERQRLENGIIHVRWFGAPLILLFPLACGKRNHVVR
jgi:hypothetical protein